MLGCMLLVLEYHQKVSMAIHAFSIGLELLDDL